MSEKEIKDEEKETDEIEFSKNSVENTDFSDRAVSSVFEWGNTLIAALIIVVLLMTFVFRQVTVDGVSMENTLKDGDRLITTEVFYTPHNGDIVVISNGKKYIKPIIKRIIATPGQTLSIDFENNEVVVDGVLLDETYIKGRTIRPSREPLEIPSVIPEGYVFVMGDNRENSLDSRSAVIDLIPVEDIMGKAVLRLYPFNSIGILS
ncbi:MAG: signal peptidase I [Acutalibacteraceae bacterium]